MVAPLKGAVEAVTILTLDGKSNHERDDPTRDKTRATTTGRKREVG
jgi:hypothetical protein